MAEGGCDILCDWCLHDDNNVTASQYCFECSHKLCTVCVSLHGKCKPLINHKLTNIEGHGFNVESIELVRSLQQCPNHPIEIVKYFCKDHDEVCCNECAIVTHRNCKYLIPLSELCKNRSRETGSATLNSLIELDEQANALLSHEKNNRDVISESKERIIDELAVVKNDLDNAFKTIERKVLREVDNRCKLQMNKSISSCTEIEQLLNTIISTKYNAKLVVDKGDTVLCYLFDRQQRKNIGAFHSSICELVEKTKLRDIHLVQLKSVSEICKTFTDSLKIEDVISIPSFSFGLSSACDEVIEGEGVTQAFEHEYELGLGIHPSSGKKTASRYSYVQPDARTNVFDSV